MHWPRHNTAHAEKKKYTKNFDVFCFPTRSRRDIPENSKTPTFSTLNSYKNRQSRSMWKLVETMLKTQGEHRYKFHCPFRHPSRDITKTRFHIKVQWLPQKKWKKTAFLRRPAQFWEFRSEILTSFFNRMCTQTESRPFFFFFLFHASYGQFCIVQILISAICLQHKKKNTEKRPAFHLLVRA